MRQRLMLDRAMGPVVTYSVFETGLPWGIGFCLSVLTDYDESDNIARFLSITIRFGPWKWSTFLDRYYP